ncbi:MAG: glycosyltransferase family 4 protein [Oscillatoriophycideae cyanobacterium NC_groundwater_1537_Pr4_S-0.65um_50_18]|nr:glycosyltransferase family 4 protein [Oscillatoriophycideae cyanobacterium NC_groundwater_1537_Pr4_S-0.65um_50_18]
MKLLFVIPEYPPHSGGGITTFYRHLLPELCRQGHQVHVLAGSAFSPALPSYHAAGLTVEFLDPQRVTANLVKFDRYRATPEFQRHLAAAWAAWEQVEGGIAYDLVETTDWGLLFVPWIVSPKSPPTIVQLHASIGQIDVCDPQLDTPLQGNLIRLIEVSLLAIADELQANSLANANAWNQLLRRKVTYIPPALSAQPIAATEPSIHGLVVGRVQYWKGATVLCEALRLLGYQAPKIDWLGRDTVYQESGLSMAGYLKQTYGDVWGTRVRSLGERSPAETQQRQANAGYMIVPSIWDVFNYACVEGMAQGQPVLCSQGAGAVDLITPGVNGLTFAANDPSALAASLNTLLSMTKQQRQAMGAAARQTIATQLSPSEIAQQRTAAYEQVVQRGRFSTPPNDWLLEAVSPGQPLATPLAFLNHLPLRELSQYVLQRSVQKLVRSTTR